MTFCDNTSFKTTVVIYPRSSDSLIIWAAADRLRRIKLCSAELGTYRCLTAPKLRNKELVFDRETDSRQYVLQSFAVLLTGTSEGQHFDSVTSQQRKRQKEGNSITGR